MIRDSIVIAKTTNNENIQHLIKVAPYSYLKFWVFYATFGLAKFTTNTLKTRQSDYFKETHIVLNYLCVKNMVQF